MDEQAQHTPTPWAVNPVKAQIDEMHGLTPICKMLWPTDIRSEGETEANARRIVAAVNACEGIPTEALEAGVVREVYDALYEALELMRYKSPAFELLIARMERVLRVLAKARGDDDAS